jgi:hypothetical protein
MSEEHRSCDQVMPLEMASNNAKTSSLFHDIWQGMTQVHLTLKTAVQNRREKCKEHLHNLHTTWKQERFRRFWYMDHTCYLTTYLKFKKNPNLIWIYKILYYLV